MKHPVIKLSCPWRIPGFLLASVLACAGFGPVAVPAGTFDVRTDANHALFQRIVPGRQNKPADCGTDAMESNANGTNVQAAGQPVVGIGVALRAEGRDIVIAGFVPDSPAAAQYDIHVGDRIIAVAQETGPAVAVQGEKLAEAVALIRGPAGTTVRLTIVPPGQDDSRARVVSFVRARLKTPPY